MSVCDKSLINSFKKSFIHGSSMHLAVNLFTFFKQSNQMLKTMNMQKYMTILIMIIIVEALIDYVTTDYKKCSIGFSGVIMGMISFYYMYNSNKLTNEIIINLVILLIPTNSKTSVMGHFLGIISGFVVYYLNKSLPIL